VNTLGLRPRVADWLRKGKEEPDCTRSAGEWPRSGWMSQVFFGAKRIALEDMGQFCRSADVSSIVHLRRRATSILKPAEKPELDFSG